MDPRYYCDVCKIFCGDATGKLLHMVSVEHYEAYQSYLALRHRTEEPTIVQKCGNHCGASHQIGSNEESLDEMSCSLQSISSCNKNGDNSGNKQNAVLSFIKNNTYAVPKKDKSIVQIIVTGFSCSIETVRKSFLEFGFIMTFQAIGGIICITYIYMSSAEKLLRKVKNSKIIINNVEFKVITQLLHPMKGHKILKIPTSAEKMFTSGGNFESKMRELMLETELDSSEKEKQNQVCISIVECLNEQFNPIAHPFGSRVAGLATKTSDLDIYLEITKPPGLVQSMLKRELVREITHTIGDRLKSDEDFSNIVEIPEASTAIVKCLHKPTKIRCDISFQAPYCVFNTSMIFFYQSLDYRVKPLLVFIRYWAKVHGFIGMNRFHNYTLSLMVVFYLQQISILPSSATLMNNVKESERILAGLWECGFSEDISLLPKITNTSSFLEVLKGFFNFYSNFNFRKYVISPYLGVAIERSQFAQGLKSDYNTQFTQYLSNCVNKGEKPLDVSGEVCVQDVFTHNHNVAASFKCWKILADFVAFCNIYARVCESIYETFMNSSDCDGMLQERYQKSQANALFCK